jgi:hypothetical protein
MQPASLAAMSGEMTSQAESALSPIRLRLEVKGAASPKLLIVLGIRITDDLGSAKMETNPKGTVRCREYLPLCRLYLPWSLRKFLKSFSNIVKG